MKGDKYHLVKLPMGWMALLGGERGLKRASLKPSPQEAVQDLGTELDLSLIHICRCRRAI